jgi:hypothetical protein
MERSLSFLRRYIKTKLDRHILEQVISMDQIPYWESNSHSGSQEAVLHLWNPKIHCRFHKS